MREFKDVLLVSPNTIKSYGDINLNVDDSKIAAAIRISQNVYLADVIGMPLIERLQELVYGKVSGSGDTIDDPQFLPYKTLLDEYVEPTLAYKTASELCMLETLKIRNMGVVKNSDVNVNITATSDAKYLQNYYLTFAVDHLNKMVAFLCENKGAFPESKIDCTCGSQPLFANTGFWLGE